MVLKHTRLGQHFLTDQKFIDNLLELAAIKKHEEVFEIGAGDGKLTRLIAKRCSYVLSYELDAALFRTTRESLKDIPNIELINADALNSSANGFDCVISSLPYYLSGRFIEWLSYQDVPRAALIIQKDFYDKLVAKPGERKYGSRSVIAQFCFKLTEGDVVPNNAFSPSPRVTSIVIRLDRINKLENMKGLFKGLKILFSFRGKTVKATEKILRKIFPGVQPILPDGNFRIEELGPQQAIQAANAISLVIE